VSTSLTRWCLSGAACAVLLLGVARAADAQQGKGKGKSGDDDRTPVVPTESGPVRGSVNQGVSIYLGIPYAAPPLGELRWRPPVRPASWHKPRAALAYGNTCMQTNTLGVFAAPSAHEDCLFLNVFAPSDRKSGHPHAGRPVMVWIHGGGLFDGESNDYDGSKLVRDGGVVLVTINYRLNILGFLAHPALDSEGHAAVNYGLMDQQFALQWVQRNIAAFGGDPGNVTIFGESAGGGSVLFNLISPTAKGLFHRGIVESGAYAITTAQALPTLQKAELTGQQFAEAVGCPDQTAACLRALPVEQIIAKGGAFTGTFIQAIDGTILTQQVKDALASGQFNRVPVVNGTNHDEMTWFVGLTELATGHVLTAADYPISVTATFGATIGPQVIAHYPLSDYASPSLAFAAAQTDQLMACPARRLDQLLTKYLPTYGYEFDDRNAPFFFPAASFPYGAAHTLEIQYLFPLYHGGQGVPKPLNASQTQLSNDMVSYWTRFAASGNPNSGAAPTWPRFTGSSEQMESLHQPAPAPIEAAAFADDHKCEFWDSLE
jgi:para-nitrobenzyl esterase